MMNSSLPLLSPTPSPLPISAGGSDSQVTTTSQYLSCVLSPPCNQSATDISRRLGCWEVALRHPIGLVAPALLLGATSEDVTGIATDPVASSEVADRHPTTGGLAALWSPPGRGRHSLHPVVFTSERVTSLASMSGRRGSAGLGSRGALRGGYDHLSECSDATNLFWEGGENEMAQRARLTSTAVDEALDAQLATKALVKAINAAIRDGEIDPHEAALLDQLTSTALCETRESTQAAQKADAHAWAIHAFECGRFDTKFLRQTAAELGFDADVLNELIDERETATV